MKKKIYELRNCLLHMLMNTRFVIESLLPRVIQASHWKKMQPSYSLEWNQSSGKHPPTKHQPLGLMTAK